VDGLSFVGWIVIGLVAGFISAWATGGRTPRGWMPSLVIGIVGALLAGWFVTSIMNVEAIHSFWVSALIATAAAIIVRYVLKAVSFAE
jgi:uncharacterized membrane protein YeaQ/YmgE (transglycosylase-associated protein family)